MQETDHTHYDKTTPTNQPKLSTLFMQKASQMTGDNRLKRDLLSHRGESISLNNPSHVTLGERLGVRALAERVGSCGLPRLSTNKEELQSVLKGLMIDFSVVGVSSIVSRLC